MRRLPVPARLRSARLLLPRPPRLRSVAAVLTAVAALLLPLTAGQPAHAASVRTCDPQGTIAAGDYIIQANEWNSTAQQCVTYSGGTAWSLDTANFNLATNGAPATYPSIFKGCHWGECTSGSGLPIEVDKITSALSSWSTTQPAAGAYDVAYDLWINSTPTTIGQPDGTEIMIWLNSRGGVQPFGGKTGTSSAAGHNWDVWTGRQTSWKIISYVLQGGGTSFAGLDVKALIDDAVGRGSVNPSHYLIDAEAGFEVWQGGQGLATTGFDFSASSGTVGGGSDTQAPTAPTGLTATAVGANSVSLSWSPATDNVGVVDYLVYHNDDFRGNVFVGSSTSTSFTQSGLPPSTTYTYRVSARDKAGNVSTLSNPATVTTPAGPGGGTGGAGCSAAYTVNDWGSGFTADVAVTNTGSAALHGWKVSWTYAGNQKITSSWNAAVAQSGAAVTAGSMSYNGALAPAASTHFGVQGTYSGGNTTPTPSCTAS